jgi:hypothetical protein
MLIGWREVQAAGESMFMASSAAILSREVIWPVMTKVPSGRVCCPWPATYRGRTVVSCACRGRVPLRWRGQLCVAGRNGRFDELSGIIALPRA